MNPRWLPIFLLSGLSALALASAQTKDDFARGELLYSTHCVACHGAQIHWRDKKLAKNWASLKVEVDRWQRLAALGWNNDEIEDVARYLNAVYYHFSSPRLGRFPDGDATKDGT
jgi:mono/diheme cytochrome c family protein